MDSLCFILVALLSAVPCSSLHLKGTWKSSEFFLFLAKFGFQRTDPLNLDLTQGFIYGNVTSKNKAHDHTSTIVVVDSEYFMEFYGNRSMPIDKACPVMMNKIQSIAFDMYCNPSGVEDFLRRVPCPQGAICLDEDTPANLVPGYQFTYKVKDTETPRFWYMAMVSCHREAECVWRHAADKDAEISYDIWLVNGDPSNKHLNPFEHQFSFEYHDVFEIHLIAFLLLSSIGGLWLYAFKKQRHPLTTIFTACISVEISSVVLSLIHVSIFAVNGRGAVWLDVMGNLGNKLADCLFMLFLLLLAKGWAITVSEVSGKVALWTVWGIYVALNISLFIWGLTEVDVISNIDEWQTWPGYLTLAFRLVIMVWFIIELRQTFQHSANISRLTFFQHFGAFCLVWFVYLPLLILISNVVSFLWRYKTILSISYAADALAFGILVNLLWPSKCVLYLVTGETPIPTYDLEITGLLDDDNQETTLFTQTDLDKERDKHSDLDDDTDDRPSRKFGNPRNGHVAGVRNGAGVRKARDSSDQDIAWTSL